MTLSGGLWSRKCTCAVETESDSEADSDSEPQQLDPASPERGSDALNSSLSRDAAVTATTTTTTTTVRSLALDQHLTGARAMPRKTSGVRDPIQTSHALHNSEALRQAQTLQNVFCACYETETVLSLVQKRERMLSPMQIMLLEPENIAQVFIYATHFPDPADAHSSSSRHLHAHHSHRSHHRASHHQLLAVVEPSSQKAPQHGAASQSPLAEPDKYRRPYIATEIIMRFYAKAITWHGSPKLLSSTSPVKVSDHSSSSSGSGTMNGYNTGVGRGDSARNGERAVFVDKSPEKPPPPPPHKPFLLGLTGSFRRSHEPLRRDANSSNSSNDSRFSDPSEASAAVRGYILRIEDLTLVEWKRIFSGMYRFLWGPLHTDESDANSSSSSSSSNSAATTGTAADPKHVAEKTPTSSSSSSSSSASGGASGIDSMLLANMCRITKNFAVFPSVHAILTGIDAPEGETLFARLAKHAYNPEVASLLHGLAHLARGRGYSFQPILRSLVAQIIDVPAELPPASAHSSTAQFNLRNPLVHARISGCADVLVKVLTAQFPNTFSYYIQAKRQLASFESVEAFEREIFPPKVLPSDRTLHAPLQDGVLAALLESTTDVTTRIAEVGVAEIRYLDANYMDGAGIPTVLVLDVLKCAVDLSVGDAARLRLLVPPVQLVVETLCAAINYHEHISTISEFASRGCFSDSDSEDSQSEDAALELPSLNDRRDTAQNQSVMASTSSFVLPTRVLPMSTTRSPVAELARRHLQLNLIEPPATCISPTSGQRVINHRPLASILLVVHVVEFMDAAIRMGNEALDRQFARFGLARSLLDIFEKFPRANILHCRLVTLYLHLLDRVAPTGRVNNPLLRSVFRPPDSILAFILTKLHASAMTHPYDAHLAILGVKIDKICAAPRLDQELIRQYCNSTADWSEFSSSLVASHYQQIDALDDAVLGISSLANGTLLHGMHGRRGSDGADDVFPLARRSSSATGFLSQELEPFRRLPIEKEGFGSRENLAHGTDAVSPTDMFRSRSQSQYPQSIIDVLRADTGTSLDAVEDDASIAGYVYQKRSKWVKVHLRFDKESCLLTLEDAPALASSSSSSPTSKPGVAGSPAKPKSTSKLKQFLMATTQHWTSARPKKLVVCNARKWIAFGRSVKTPGIGAFGFQVEAFDRSREVDQTLTFVTRSDATRTLWFEGMQHAMTASQALRNSITDEDDEANLMLVQCVATKREHHEMLYLVVPSVHLLGPVVAPTFFIKSEVPEELPFWGTFHGTHGITQYASLLTRCVRVRAVREKRMYASGYSVIAEFDATFERVESADAELKMPAPLFAHGSTRAASESSSLSSAAVVTVSCTDTYLVSGNQIIGLTRTIADSEKLMAMLCDDE